MLYLYNKKTLEFKKVTNLSIFIGLFVLLLISTIISYKLETATKVVSVTKEIVLKRQHEFTPEKLEKYVHDLHIKYPDIVMAQARLETGNFSSTIFKENNNCFGIKHAIRRPTTSLGSDREHAYYNTWQESVQDYALLQASILNLYKINNEEDYLNYLKENYAENPNYIKQLQIIMNN